MKHWQTVFGVLFVVGLGTATYFLKPVRGPERDLTLVADAEHGAYLITLSGCVACHTDVKNGRARLSGGPALKSPFGTFYAPNITPDPVFGIGNLTLVEFSNALSNGEGGGVMNHLYPAFPYDSYTYLSDQDVVDLYTALQMAEAVAEASVPHEVPFPFNIRLSLAGWKNLFFKPERFTEDPARSEQWNRGKYLAYGPAHCVACHTPRNALGGRDDSRALQGSSGTPGGNVPGITAARLVAQGYDKATLIETLQTGFTPGFDVLGGPMGEVVEESTSHWQLDDLAALAVFLFDED
jgi:mono/diheme cytochrome c family protein